jgi:DNA polymerase
VTIGSLRGKILDLGQGRKGVVTIHPSALLRLQDEPTKQKEFAAFVDDLLLAAAELPAVKAELK